MYSDAKIALRSLRPLPAIAADLARARCAPNLAEGVLQVEYTLTYEIEEMELQELLDNGDIAVGAPG